MNWAARNVANKLIWMTRQLRRINTAPEIQDWAAAIHSLNNLLLAVSNSEERVARNEVHKRSAPSNWRSKTSIKVGSVTQEKQTVRRAATKAESPQLSKRGTKKVVIERISSLLKGKLTYKANVDEKQKLTLSSKDMEIDELIRVEPSREVERDLEIARGVLGVEKNDLVNERKTMLNYSDTEVRQQWKEELHRMLKIHGGNCLSEWRWKTVEWGAHNDLLKNIAGAIGRDFETDIEKKSSNLRSFLEDEINRYLKTGAYSQ